MIFEREFYNVLCRAVAFVLNLYNVGSRYRAEFNFKTAGNFYVRLFTAGKLILGSQYGYNT